MDLNTFITENSVLLIIIGVVIVLTIIGYIAQKTEFGKKVSEKTKQKEPSNAKTDEMQFEILDDNVNNLFDESDKTIEEPVEQLDILDTIEPNFNSGNLIIGDVNENPAISNEELGIQEDLYAPFGDQQFSNDNIENLKIEDVVEDDFVVVEKNKNDDAEVVASEILEPLSDNQNVPTVEELQIEDVGETLEIFEPTPQTDPLVDTINNLVDNTFVINDATDDFETFNSENIVQDNVDDLVDNIDNNINVQQNYEESKIKQFEIEDEELHINEQPDYELETTTSLKLDEINEKIKNLKLEDLDNSTFEEEVVVPKKKNKKQKKVSVKSVDDIKKEKNIEESTVIEKTEDLNEKKVDDSTIIDDEVISDEVDSTLELPNLDEIVKNETNDEEVNEADDNWSF